MTTKRKRINYNENLLQFKEEDIGEPKIIKLIDIPTQDFMFVKYEDEIYKWQTRATELKKIYKDFLRIMNYSPESPRRDLRVTYEGTMQRGNYLYNKFFIEQRMARRMDWFELKLDLSFIQQVSPNGKKYFMITPPRSMGGGSFPGAVTVENTIRIRDFLRMNCFNICQVMDGKRYKRRGVNARLEDYVQNCSELSWDGLKRVLFEKDSFPGSQQKLPDAVSLQKRIDMMEREIDLLRSKL